MMDDKLKGFQRASNLSSTGSNEHLIQFGSLVHFFWLLGTRTLQAATRIPSVLVLRKWIGGQVCKFALLSCRKLQVSITAMFSLFVSDINHLYPCPRCWHLEFHWQEMKLITTESNYSGVSDHSLKRGMDERDAHEERRVSLANLNCQHRKVQLLIHCNQLRLEPRIRYFRRRKRHTSLHIRARNLPNPTLVMFMAIVPSLGVITWQLVSDSWSATCFTPGQRYLFTADRGTDIYDLISF